MKVRLVTCETCGEQLREEDAIRDTRTSKAWHVEHYGAAEDVAARVAKLRAEQDTRAT